MPTNSAVPPNVYSQADVPSAIGTARIRPRIPAARVPAITDMKRLLRDTFKKPPLARCRVR